MLPRETIFVNYHVPRTAGRTLGKILSDFFDESTILNTMDDSAEVIGQFIQLDDAAKKRYRLVTGHMPYGLIHLIPEPRFVITFVRNPIIRCLSEYDAMKKWKDHPVAKIINEHDLSIGQFFLSGLKKTILDNSLVRSFLIEPPEDEEIGAEHVDLALQNFDRDIAFVGNTERMHDSLEKLARMSGLRIDLSRVPKVGNMNAKRSISDISKEDLKVLQHVTRYDFVLYEHALRRFAQNQ
ncbi:sulfotransferase family 2 domain-containing protein [Salidesulfovibrio onnuriiensis]|uniref:sulfotransferase family 2 domain-containing protein n=1 Tax=Salidesulfovibrio onnuriiensis TaxID=2583823 RepID=UPI0011C8E813|nr:sulfotransferase family 2 domain-containing protein [Salidesulfovibrio onnuriiensis]